MTTHEINMDALGLSQHQRTAVEIVTCALDAYNSTDGAGLFAGLARYHVLQSRLTLAAVRSRDLVGFWGLLLRSMRWPIPPMREDRRVLNLLAADGAREVLHELATNAAPIVQIARMIHTAEKGRRRNEAKMDDLDDNLEGI